MTLKAVSISAVSIARTGCPCLRASRAASTPIATHWPVPKSISDGAQRVGGVPSWPVICMMPLWACTKGS